MAQKPKFW